MSRNRIAADLARQTGQSYQAMLRTIDTGHPDRRPAVVIACASPAGGEGKTTIAVHLAAALAQAGARVLAVDCDHQGDLHWTLTGGRTTPTSRTTPWITVKEEGDGRIAVAQAPMLGRDARHEIRRLRNVLRPARQQFDIVLLDSPPDPPAVDVARNADALIVPVNLGSRFWARPATAECASLYAWLDESFDTWLDEHNDEDPAGD
jgi:Mrp family chromosome partitioning ATPase